MRSNFKLKHYILIPLLTGLSSQSLAQANEPPSYPPDYNGNIGPDDGSRNDPILSPDEERIRGYLDPPIIVGGRSGPPEDPNKPRKGGMKKIPAPTLKLENDDKKLPVHDIRKDVGPTTQSKLEDLQFLRNRRGSSKSSKD